MARVIISLEFFAAPYVPGSWVVRRVAHLSNLLHFSLIGIQRWFFFLSLLQCLLVVYNDLLLARCRFAWRLLKKKFAIVCIGSAAFCIGRTLATTLVMHRYILSSWSWSFLRHSPISFFKMRCTYVPTRDLPSMIERVWLRWPYGVVYAIAVSVAKNITMNVLTAI